MKISVERSLVPAPGHELSGFNGGQRFWAGHQGETAFKREGKKGIIGDARMFSAFVTSLVSERMQHRQQRVVEDLSK